MKTDSNNPFAYYFDALTHHYFDYTSTASRKEFWMYSVGGSIFLIGCFCLLGFILGLLGVDTEQGFFMVLSTLVQFFLFGLPSISMMVRRIRHIGLNPWFAIFWFLCPLLWIVFGCIPGKKD